MSEKVHNEAKEKRLVAISSVLAAVLLTSLKIVVGLATGSLGIISEALHSALDLIAASMTYVAVKISDKPPDETHNFGHGKVENLSALFQTILLLITCVWIAYEALSRLISGETEIVVSFWSFAVIIVSIIVDISRSRALSRVAKKYNSQALEADALHFTTDIYSSSVVLLGLLGSLAGYYFLDSIAALIVAVFVFIVSIRLGKRSIDVLLDKSPGDIAGKILSISHDIPEIIDVHDLKVRLSGAFVYVELNIHVNSELSIEEAHKISHRYEKRIIQEIKKCIVHVHIEPENEEI